MVVRVARVTDTTGAGDAFVGVMAARLAAGRSLLSAVRSASIAAALSVTVPGAADSYTFEFAAA